MNIYANSAAWSGLLVMLGAPAVASAELPAPIHHWTFDEAAGSGLARDAIGGKVLREGRSAVESIQYGVPGKRGAAVYFPERDKQDFLRLDGDPILRDGPWSISVWVKPDPDSSVDALGFRQLFLPSSPGSYRIQIETRIQKPTVVKTKLPGVFRTVDDIAAFTGGKPVPMGEWTHLMFVSTGTELRLYMNGARSGAAIARKVALDFYNLRSVRLGIDELRIYDKAFDDDEVKELLITYEVPGPLHYWAFDEPEGSKQAIDTRGGKTLNEGRSTIESVKLGVPGKRGRAVQFLGRGKADFLRVKPTPITLEGPWSLACWVYVGSDSTVDKLGFRQFLLPAADGTRYRIQLETRVRKPAIRNTRVPGLFRNVNDVVPFADATPVPQDRWVHVAFVSTGTELRLYTDGARNGEPIAKRVVLDMLELKSIRTAVDELTIYDKPLTDEQVALLASF
jgi:hypothetical protein